MLISVVSDGTELSNYSLVKMLNSASKSWKAEVLAFYINSENSGEKFSSFTQRMSKKATELGVKVKFESLKKTEERILAKRICSTAGSQGVTGLFIPENMSTLFEELKSICTEIPVEEVSSDLFPSLMDLMTRKVATVNVGDTLKHAAGVMVKNGIGSLIVMDRGRVEGILTEHDFVKAYSRDEGKEKYVKDVMSHPVIKLDRTGSVFEACELMKRNKIKKLVIMDGNELLGIVTTTDLARLPLSISDGLNYLVARIRDLSI